MRTPEQDEEPPERVTEPPSRRKFFYQVLLDVVGLELYEDLRSLLKEYRSTGKLTSKDRELFDHRLRLRLHNRYVPGRNLEDDRKALDGLYLIYLYTVCIYMSIRDKFTAQQPVKESAEEKNQTDLDLAA